MSLDMARCMLGGKIVETTSSSSQFLEQIKVMHKVLLIFGVFSHIYIFKSSINFIFENNTKEQVVNEMSRELPVLEMYLFLAVKWFPFFYDGIKFIGI